MAIAKRLLEKYPSKEFWMTVKVPFLLNSMGFFLNAGEQRIKDMYNVFFLQDTRVISEAPTVLDEKIGEDKTIIKKPTLKDLLK